MSIDKAISHLTRRNFLRKSIITAAAFSLAPLVSGCSSKNTKEPIFKISLGQWSLNRTIQSGKMKAVDFPSAAKKEYGLEAVEYVNQLFMDKANDQAFLNEMKKKADDAGVKSLLIMVDQEGLLGHPDKSYRIKAIENHYKWVDAAQLLGCHSIRVNAYSEGTYEEQLNYCTEGLRTLAEYGEERGINIIVENHGGMSSRGDWLAQLMKKADHKYIGTMPDFDNFVLPDQSRYDRYKGMKEIMPWAKSVSSKAHDFDGHGNETSIDFKKMCKIVTDAGYHGYISAEYEGERLSEPEGLKATIRLLEKVREEIEGKKHS